MSKDMSSTPKSNIQNVRLWHISAPRLSMKELRWLLKDVERESSTCASTSANPSNYAKYSEVRPCDEPPRADGHENLSRRFMVVMNYEMKEQLNRFLSPDNTIQLPPEYSKVRDKFINRVTIMPVPLPSEPKAAFHLFVPYPNVKTFDTASGLNMIKLKIHFMARIIPDLNQVECKSTSAGAEIHFPLSSDSDAIHVVKTILNGNRWFDFRGMGMACEYVTEQPANKVGENKLSKDEEIKMPTLPVQIVSRPKHLSDSQRNTLKTHVQTAMKNFDPSHDIFHVERVVTHALDIARHLCLNGADLNLELVEIIAWMHDVFDEKYAAVIACLHDVVDDKYAAAFDRPSEQDMVTKVVMEVAPEYKDQIDLILTSIKQLGFANSLGKTMDQQRKEMTIYAQIVRDADFLDATGAIGIARTFAYGATKNIPLFDPAKLPAMSLVTKQDYRERGNSSVICHVFEKLVHLPNLMFTKYSQMIGLYRHTTLLAYVNFFINQYPMTEVQRRAWEAVVAQHTRLFSPLSPT